MQIFLQLIFPEFGCILLSDIFKILIWPSGEFLLIACLQYKKLLDSKVHYASDSVCRSQWGSLRFLLPYKSKNEIIIFGGCMRIVTMLSIGHYIEVPNGIIVEAIVIKYFN